MRNLGLCLFLFLFTGAQLELTPIYYGQDWDYLLFTLHWPPTVCVDWNNLNPKHQCSMPSPPDSWTIHGIWPTKTGTIGPQFCNRTWFFDPEQVKPIEDRLEKYWTNIEADTSLYSLWSHEWFKHGTCAAQIDPLNSELKYFSKGLDLAQGLAMSQLLAESNIVPSDDKAYSLNDIYDAVKSKLNVSPQIECRDERGGKQYLFEIRVCFSKELEMIDCELNHDHNPPVTTNCKLERLITYPASYYPPKTIFVHLYQLINIFQWFTL